MVALAAAVGGASGCYREFSDANTTAAPRYAGKAPWMVDGVRPGAMLAEVRRVLGEPREMRPTMGKRVAHWSGRDTMVTFDAADRAVEVFGHRLMAEGRTLVSAGAAEAEIVQTLGKAEVSSSYRPKGGGIISIGRELTSRTFTYENAGVRFEITVPKDGGGYIRATAH